ncbi:hypothetical protein PTTG_02599 [Puccinia triticina 1-1 BBBD Race 1]|uniref:CMP/dCMP-type deaminase domain-containing protein n=1 Tax=Puccinia triticina (isolate 1-1 / race 1 (BBBD)) TaxID=630390 RepID=A0A180GDV6_PUCT1|nr:hypothetical protein PTTG_02599 [Puccinia triticina 1-1 BBBD Race 1]
MTSTWSKEDQEQKERLEQVIQIIDGYRQNLVDRPSGKTNSAENEEFFPFELITQQNPFSTHRNSANGKLAGGENFFKVWIIDCDHSKFISTLFQFIRANIYLNRNESDREAIKHLKSIKPITRNHLDESVEKLYKHPVLRVLLEHSTPYRIRVPSKRTLCEHHWSQAHGDGLKDSEGERMINPAGWPVVELDETAQMNMMSATMKANQRILQRRWSVAEISWLLTQARLVAELALKSKLEAGEVGVGAAVSSYSLDPPEELAHLVISIPQSKHQHGTVENPILLTATDARSSTANPLRHAVVELTSVVSSRDLAQPRRPETALHPVPYLLTNQVVFLTHEPCLLCAMALLHSRIKHLFFLLPSPGSGGCGSVYNVHEQDGLNHKYFVWKLKIPRNLSDPSPADHLLNTFFDA